MKRIIAAAIVLAAAPSGAALAPAAADSTTTITFRMPDCNGCRITAYDARENNWDTVTDSTPDWSTTSTVRKSVAVVNVPTARTKGMAFAVDAGPYSASNAVPMIALRYGGQSVGSRVSQYQAAAATRGSFCWAGTTRSRVVMRLGVSKWIDHSVPKAAPGYRLIQVWAARTQRTWRDAVNMGETYDGMLGIQQGPFCFRSSS